MRFPEERYSGLTAHTKAPGSSVPIAISEAVGPAFKHPSVKRKSPTYVNMSITVLSKWLLDKVMYASLE
jgi:hypothetical protein